MRRAAWGSAFHSERPDVPLYAISGFARSGASRSDRHSNAVMLSIDGVEYGVWRDYAVEAFQPDAFDAFQGGGFQPGSTPFGRILSDSLSITDTLYEAPSTARA